MKYDIYEGEITGWAVREIAANYTVLRFATKDEAQRIAALLNAADGMTTDAIAALGVGGLGRVVAERERLRAAVERYLALESVCEYVMDEPDVCPGIEQYGVPCHWCQLRAALADDA